MRRSGGKDEQEPLLAGESASEFASTTDDDRFSSFSSAQSLQTLADDSYEREQRRRARRGPAVAMRVHGEGESTFRPGQSGPGAYNERAALLGNLGFGAGPHHARRPSVSAAPTGINDGDDRDTPDRTAHAHATVGSIVGSLSAAVSEALNPNNFTDYEWELPSNETAVARQLQQRALGSKFDRRRLRFYGAVGLAVDEDQLYSRTMRLMDADAEAQAHGVSQGAVGVSSMMPAPRSDLTASDADNYFREHGDGRNWRVGNEGGADIRDYGAGPGKMVDYDSEDGLDVQEAGVVGGSASAFSTVFNLSNTAIGAGTLAIPFAISQAGLAVGVGFLCLVGLMAGFSSNLLLTSMQYAGGLSYKDLAVSAFGRWGARTVEFSLILLTYGTLCAYLVVISNLADPIAKFAGGDAKVWYLNGHFVLGIAVVVCVLPLSMLKSMNALRYTSLVAILMLSYLVVMVMGRCIDALVTGKVKIGAKGNEIVWFNESVKTFYSFPLMTLAFTFHMNLAPLYQELKNPTPHKMQMVVNKTILMSGFFYVCIGVFGYLLFFDKTMSNILQNFTNQKDVLVLIGNIGLLGVTSFSFPLIHYPCRGNVLTLFFKGSQSNFLHYGLTFLLIGSAFGVASIPGLDLGFVFGLVGSTVGLFLVFILPAAMFLRLSPNRISSPKKVFALGLFIVGWILVIICLYAVLAPQK